MVQEALEMMLCLATSIFSWLTPMTTVMSSPLAGAEMMTFFAPASMWPLAFSASVKRPVRLDDVIDPQLAPRQRLRDAFTARHLILWPLTTRTSSSARSD